MARNPVLSLLAILLAAPLAIFDGAFLAPVAAVVSICALLAGLALLLPAMPKSASCDAATLAACIAAGFLLALLGGEGRYFFATDDWIIRDAVMGDLVQGHWPIAYERNSVVMWLRAPLGLYLAPALIGKAAGMGAAWTALIVQDALLMGLILAAFVNGASGRARWIILAVFLAFSGCDLIAWLVEAAKGAATLDSLEMRYGRLVYVSHLTQFFWAPHHSLAGWSFVAAYLGWRKGELSATALAAIFVLTLFWSPLAGIGALPFLAFAGLRDLVSGKLRPAMFVAPALCTAAALPCILYMMKDSGGVESGWTIFDDGFLLHYVELIGLEVLPFLLYLWLAPGALRDGATEANRRIEFALISATLLLLPLYWVHFTNDLLLRASIPALALLALRVGENVVVDWRDGFGPRRWIIPVLVIGAATPAVEIGRSLLKSATPASTCNLLDAWDTGPWRMWPLTAYLADAAAFEKEPQIWRGPASIVKAQGRTCPLEKPGT